MKRVRSRIVGQCIAIPCRPLFSTLPTTLHSLCTIPAPCPARRPRLCSSDGATGLKTPAVAQSWKSWVSIAAGAVRRPRNLGLRFRVRLLRIWTGTAPSGPCAHGPKFIPPPHPKRALPASSAALSVCPHLFWGIERLDTSKCAYNTRCCGFHLTHTINRATFPSAAL
jgi:hypothetical protein